MVKNKMNPIINVIRKIVIKIFIKRNNDVNIDIPALRERAQYLIMKDPYGRV